MIKNIRRLLSKSWLLFALIGTGCSEAPDDGISENTGGELAEFTLTIPDVERYTTFGTATRADATAKPTSEEAHLTNIYLVAVPANQTDANTAFKVISLRGREVETNTYYTRYYVSLYPGDYKFYVVANLDRYLTGEDSSTTILNEVHSEADLQNCVLKFQEHQRIMAGILPMMCKPEEATKGGRNNNGVITVNAGDNEEIVAPLKFLCSKVRYTILFDAREGGISEEFGSSRINFNLNEDNPATASVIVTTSDLYNEKDYSNEIANNDFASLGGWNVSNLDPDNAFLAINEHVGEFYQTYKFKMSQVLKNMPEGNYRLEMQGFFRNGPGTWDYGNANDRGLKRHEDGREQLLVSLYISDNSKTEVQTLKSLYSETCSSFNSDYPYPDSMGQSNTAFNEENKYHNTISLRHEVTGSIEIGLKRDDISERVYGDWTCFDNFRLYYTPFEKITTVGTFSWNLDMNRFGYDMSVSDVPGYPSNYDDNRLSAYEEEMSKWEELDHKAWQGIVYLPENLSESKTTLNFPYAYGSDTEKPNEQAVKSIPLFEKHGIEKGMFYDLVILIKSIDSFGLHTIVLESDINKWQSVPVENEW